VFGKIPRRVPRGLMAAGSGEMAPINEELIRGYRYLELKSSGRDLTMTFITRLHVTVYHCQGVARDISLVCILSPNVSFFFDACSLSSEYLSCGHLSTHVSHGFDDCHPGLSLQICPLLRKQASIHIRCRTLGCHSYINSRQVTMQWRCQRWEKYYSNPISYDS
jgi:hypothetical protein